MTINELSVGDRVLYNNHQVEVIDIDIGKDAVYNSLCNWTSSKLLSRIPVTKNNFPDNGKVYVQWVSECGLHTYPSYEAMIYGNGDETKFYLPLSNDKMHISRCNRYE